MSDEATPAIQSGPTTRKRLRAHAAADANAVAQKPQASEGTNGDDGQVDHRKRRRNRTIQSCLNCHGAKRMCDRKRPSCGRCTQLGMSGSCLYEIDDPTQWSGRDDENARLLKRIAELEGVIRELRSKPHPKPTTRFLKTENGNGINLGLSFDEWLLQHSQTTLLQCENNMPDAPSTSNVINPALVWGHPQPQTLLSSSPGASQPGAPSPTTPEAPSQEALTPSVSLGSSSIPAIYVPQTRRDDPLGLSFSPVSWDSSLTSPACHDADSFMCIDPCLLEEDEDMSPSTGPCGCVEEMKGTECADLVRLMSALRTSADALERAPCRCKGVSVTKDLQQRVHELHGYVQKVVEGKGLVPHPGQSMPAVK
ncbi:hypothetical protein HGRIS_007402 [Hohenbuehelia grisea]|uniref:Zn(2)-C6 fungal-type domain-containing protein n=1 Tax=Hohenbuehelia grisea TaxID=104357 RepID=A0ABR3J4P8_9AGAR